MVVKIEKKYDRDVHNQWEMRKLFIKFAHSYSKLETGLYTISKFA